MFGIDIQLITKDLFLGMSGIVTPAARICLRAREFEVWIYCLKAQEFICRFQHFSPIGFDRYQLFTSYFITLAGNKPLGYIYFYNLTL